MATVGPAEDFDPENDAKVLKKAFKGLGTDEDAVTGVLAYRSNEQRQQIALQFKTMYGKDLIKELKSELGGKYEKVILAMMLEPYVFLAKELHSAIAGLGTDEETIVEILNTYYNDDVMRISQEYENLYGKTLEKDLKNDSSGTVKRLFVSLSTANRDESDEVDMDFVRSDASELLRAGELFAGTDEATFNAILCQRNRAHLRAVFEEYEGMTGHSFEDAIRNEFSGASKSSLLGLVHALRDPWDYLATRIHDSVAGAGTDDSNLIRLIVSRSEIDLAEVRDVIEQKYGKTLGEYIENDCSGDYKRCLLALAGY